MPVFRLSDTHIFPPVELAEPNGLLAIGGDLSPDRLLLAYARGIFPWYSEGEPILWWAPAPRLILEPANFHLPKRLARTIRSQKFMVTADTAFEAVIRSCAATANRRQNGTWITAAMQQAYIQLHQLGFAHSIECWHQGQLSGGLYGICLDGVFFGESMFTLVNDASKVALAHLMAHAETVEIRIIDCQMITDHLLQFGAGEVEREVFKDLLEEHITACTPQKKWRLGNR